MYYIGICISCLVYVSDLSKNHESDPLTTEISLVLLAFRYYQPFNLRMFSL